MVTVAVVGLVMGTVVLKRRRDKFLSLANEAALWEAEAIQAEKVLRKSAEWSRRDAAQRRDRIKSMERRPRRSGDRVFTPAQREAEEELAQAQDFYAKKSEEEADVNRDQAAIQALGKAKYERAARYPWLLIQPDPAESK